MMTTEVMALPGRPLRAPRATEPAPPLCPATGQRFTINGSDALERHLARSCEKILAGIRGLIPAHKLEAVLLGGGYGRGEGGVWKSPEGDRPYNDLEFYVCLRGNRHANELFYHRPLEVLGEILTPLAGVEVEFKIISLAEFSHQPTSMFSYDLVVGHHWIWGHPGFLSRCAHHRMAEHIPLAEATRLLMNRCSGLLFAEEKLQREVFTAADADFVRRNLAKAELAFGDAILTAHGQYHWSCRERSHRLRELPAIDYFPWLDETRSHHAAGVDFKLLPERATTDRETLRLQHTQISDLGGKIWLWLESRRLGFPFVSFCAYADYDLDKCAGTERWRNVLVNLKAVGPKALLRPAPGRHPRQRVLDALTLLLWEPATLTSPTLLARAQAALHTRATSFSELVVAYRALWSRVN